MKIQAIASIPRDIGFNLHQRCIRRALMPLGLEPEEYGGAFWHEEFERLLERAIADGNDYALTLDFDSIFEPQHVTELIRLAGDYPEADAIIPWMVKRASTDRLFGVRNEDGAFRYHFQEEEFEGELMPVSTGHFGLTMIKLSSLARMPKPWLQAIPDKDGGWGPERVAADIHFWNQAVKAGLKLYLATGVRVGHLQQMITWPTNDFGIEQQHVEHFRRHGAPSITK